MKKPRKILVISHSSDLYGSERSLFDLLIQLKDDESFTFEVWVPKSGPLKDKFYKAGIPVLCTGHKRWINHNKVLAGQYHFIINIIALIAAIPKFFRYSPDLIYSNSFTNPFGLYLAKLFNKKHIWHIREFIEEDIGANFDSSIERCTRIAQKKTQLFICNSKAIYKKWSRYIKTDMKVVYNGFDFTSSKKCAKVDSNKNEFNALIVSSIQPGKCIDEALQAMLILKESEPTIKLTIHGSIEDKGHYLNLRKWCEEKGLENSIVWKGFTTNIESIYQASDVLIIPSRKEAFGRVAIEAMIQGLPVIGAKTGGLIEIIQHQETGLLYEPGDANSLAEAIKLILNDKELRLRLMTRAIAMNIDRFGIKRYAKEMAKIFNQDHSL